VEVSRQEILGMPQWRMDLKAHTSVEHEKRRGLKPTGLQLGFDAHGLSWVYTAKL
jgi:hypothetical protein